MVLASNNSRSHRIFKLVLMSCGCISTYIFYLYPLILNFFLYHSPHLVQFVILYNGVIIMASFVFFY